MLTVAKVTQGQAAGYAEYLEGRSQPTGLGDYYLKDGDRVEAPGRWVFGAAEFGLDPKRPVSGEQLRALMSVRRPDTGKELRRVGASGEAVAAIDATFSAPKSVSAVWALAAPQLREQIERAHEQAIERALGYSLEVVAMVRERIDQQKALHTHANELVATSWRHTTARAVGGQVPDPQLHSHVLLHGAIRADGKVVAIDSRSWLIHRRELGAAYRTELAYELSNLGSEIERGTGRGGRYFELRGVPRELLERWSSRHQQITAAIEQRLRDKRTRLEAMLAAGGRGAREATKRLDALARATPLTPKEDRLITTASRMAKTDLHTRSDLDREWATTASRHHFDRHRAEQLQGSPRQPQPVPESELRRRLTEFDPTFTESEARAVALEASTGVPIEQCLAQLKSLRSSGGVLPLASGQLTTRAHRAAERRTMAIAARLDEDELREIPVREHAAALERELSAAGGSLSHEQRAAIRLACSTHQLVMIEGHAGSGKSTTLQAIVSAHQAAGQRVIVTSTAALAAERLATELHAAGVNADAYSTVALNLATSSGRLLLGAHTTVIHEEAALAATREQERLLSAVEDSGARLIMLGDPRQSQAVGAGGLWPYLERAARARGAHVELTRNVRALEVHDREAQRLFREGEHTQALEEYVQRGRVRFTNAQHQAEDAALEAAQTDREHGRSTLVIAQTSNEHLDELNARAQAIRAERGELGEESIKLSGRPYDLRAGDEVQIRHTLPHPALGQLRNGTTGQVTAVDSERALLTFRSADGRNVLLERQQLDDADIRLAYVQHPFLAQGQTTDTAHLILAEQTTAEGSYVSVTRAREETHIHASRQQLELDSEKDELEALAQRMGRSEPEIPSIRYPLAREAHIREQQERELGERSQEREFDARSDGDLTLAPEDSSMSPPPFEPPRLAAALEEPPDNSQQRDTYERAGSMLARYRTRFTLANWEQVPVDEHTPSEFFEQRYRQREAADQLLDTLAQLDPRTEYERKLQERGLNTLGLGSTGRTPDRESGWEF